MQVFAIEQDFSMVYPIEDYKSFIWTDRYDTAGDFEIYIPITALTTKYLKIDNYISCDESNHLMIIEDIKTEADMDNGNFLIVTGKSLESIPSRRIIWYSITFADESLQTVVKTLLEKNIISPEDTSRAIPNFIFEESTDERITNISGISAAYAIGDNIGEIIEDLCKTYQIGYRIIPNEENRFVFSLYIGEDRSYSQTANPWIIFSPNQDNIISSRFNESTTNYKNVTLVINEKTTYSSDNPEGVTERSGLVLGATSGLSRRETFTDASGIETGEDVSEHDLLASMRVEGYKTLAEYKYDKDFESEVDYVRSYQYGTDYYLGDIVQIQDLYGNEGRERVTEYMIKEDTNGFAAYPSFTSIVEDNTGGGYSYELKLGTEHENAFYGDWGWEAYQHAQTVGNPHKTTWSDVGADELGAADKAYERAKSDAQTVGNAALRNANLYTDNQIKKLRETTQFKDWTDDILGTVEDGVERAKEYTDTKSTEDRVYTDEQIEEANEYTDTKSTEDRVYTDDQIKEAKKYTDDKYTESTEYADELSASDREYADELSAADREYTDTKSTEDRAYTDTKSTQDRAYTDTKSASDREYTDTKSTADRAYADGLIEKLVGTAPAALDTIYELAAAIQDTSVTDALRESIATKVNRSGDTMTGALTVPNLTDSGLTASKAIVTDASKKLISSAVTATELGYLSGVTSSIQTQLGAKVAKTGDTMTGALTVPNLTDSGLTASKAIVTDASKKLISSAVTATELGYLSGVTSSVQTQLNNKVTSGSGTAQYAKYFTETSIASNTDLNTIVQPGFYYCTTNAAANTLGNKASGNAFFMIVGCMAPTSSVTQIIFEYMTTGQKIYFRNCYSGSWGAWQRIYNTQNKPALTADVTGILPVANGGTGQTTVLNYAKQIWNNTGKRINASFASKFRTQTYGSNAQGYYVTPIRQDSANVTNSPIYGSGLAFGCGDTHGYLLMDYGAAGFYVGSGNADKLVWTKKVILDGDTATAAAKLATARALQVNLASTSSANFDGSANQTGIGVTGILGTAHGGTGNAEGYSQSVIGFYGGSGGKKAPNWLGRSRVKFIMTNGFTNTAGLNNWADCMLMDCYGGSDVKGVTYLALTKTSNPMRAYIGYGNPDSTANWTQQLELKTLKMVQGTLAKGATSITLSSSYITTSSLLSFYTSDYKVAPTAATVSAGKVVLTFKAQSAALTVAVTVDN